MDPGECWQQVTAQVSGERWETSEQGGDWLLWTRIGSVRMNEFKVGQFVSTCNPAPRPNFRDAHFCNPRTRRPLTVL